MRIGSLAIFEKSVIGDLFTPELPYLTRWKLVSTPWFAIYVHKIWLDDKDRHLHDHPWSFVSLILRGGYVEELPEGRRVRKPGSLRVLHRPGVHSVRSLLKTPTWTLVVRGRDHHEWGFLTEEGWKHWESYVSARSAFGESGFEAWESGPVSPEVWLSTHSFLHPLWEDTEDPVLVGQVLLDDEDLAWVVLRVDLAMRGRYEVQQFASETLSANQLLTTT